VRVKLSARRRIACSLSAPSRFPHRALWRRLPPIPPLNSQARQRSSSLLSPSPNITTRSSGREFFPVSARAPLLGPSSFSSSLPHSAIRRHRSVARQTHCVSCVAHPRSSLSRRSLSHCVQHHRRFPCPVLARFPARQRALSARSALIPSRRRPRRLSPFVVASCVQQPQIYAALYTSPSRIVVKPVEPHSSLLDLVEPRIPDVRPKISEVRVHRLSSARSKTLIEGRRRSCIPKKS
jgi:hypothetical protein